MRVPARSGPTGTLNNWRWTAFAAAAGIEGLAIAVALTWIGAQPAPKLEQVVLLTFEASSKPEPPAPAKPEVARLVPPPPKVQFKPVQPAVSLPVSTHPVDAVTERLPSPTVSVPAKVESVLPFQPLPPAPVVASSADPRPAYNAQLAAAVQAVFQVPPAARELNFKGRARVEFTLKDGVVSAIQLNQSSGFGLVDRAAMRAVQVAAYPPAPPGLQGRDGRYQIWVECY